MSRLQCGNRREFLQAALATSALAQGAQHLPAANIIDTHTHFYDPSRPQGVPWPPKSDAILYKTTLPARYRDLVRPLGVRGTIAIEADAWLEDNQWVLDLAKDNPIIVGFMGHLEPGKPEFRQHLARFGRNPLFRGIRLNDRAIASGLRQAAFVEDLQRLVDRDLALDTIGDAPLYADLVTLTDKVPKLRMIIDHMPLDAPADPQTRLQATAALRHLGQRPLVYSKVSGVLRRVNGVVPSDVKFYRKSLDELWVTFGPDRLVYGSNWPVSDHLAPYATVLKVVQEYFATKGAEASEKYFWRNSAAFYKWRART
ncbi:MAG TPA: amidohydrolase family protein [Bryobacteraceae bacterium]|nr:amidohydrolase family protein [Bryobacteraceae bacterium]